MILKSYVFKNQIPDKHIIIWHSDIAANCKMGLLLNVLLQSTNCTLGLVVYKNICP
jgi:hypothetical protein